MAKKKLWLIVCGSIVAAAIIGLVVFLIVTRSVKPTGTDASPKSIDGTWKVVCYDNNVSDSSSQATYTPDQTITLGGGEFAYYQGDAAIATAHYEFKTGAKDYSSTLSAPFYRCTLTLTDSTNPVLPGLLVVKHYSANVIELVDEASYREWRLVKLDGTRAEYQKVTDEYLKRKWDVALKGHELADIDITVGESALEINNNGKPVTMPYVFDAAAQHMDITGLGRAYVVKPNDNTLVLVVTQDGAITVWELVLA